MNESIFSVISSYTPTAFINPQENYLTELFVWIINNVPGFGYEYLNLICKKINEKYGSSIRLNEDVVIEAETQIPVVAGYIDAVIYTNVGVHFICEHKVDSELSSDQIEKYMECREELKCEGNYYSVLLVKAKWQLSQESNASLLWVDVDELVERVLTKYTDDPASAFVLKHFSKYLKDKGLGRVPPMDTEYFRTSYIQEKENVSRTDNQLKSIFKELAALDWRHIVPGIDRFIIDDKYHNEYHPKRFGPEWGRVGISFFTHWKPGLFGGILYDGEDHKLELSDKTKGPDLVVLIDVDKDLKKSFNMNSWTVDMKNRLKQNHGPFTVFVDSPKSAWRLAALQRPLYDVIKDAKSLEEQKSMIVEAIKQGIELFIGDHHAD